MIFFFCQSGEKIIVWKNWMDGGSPRDSTVSLASCWFMGWVWAEFVEGVAHSPVAWVPYLTVLKFVTLRNICSFELVSSFGSRHERAETRNSQLAIREDRRPGFSK